MRCYFVIPEFGIYHDVLDMSRHLRHICYSLLNARLDEEEIKTLRNDPLFVNDLHWKFDAPSPP